MRLFLPKFNTKINLIVLCGLITFHVIFLSSKSYVAKIELKYPRITFEINTTSEIQYQNYFNTLSYKLREDEIIQFAQSTQIKYVFNLPEKTLYFIYFGYFMVATIFILSTKSNLNNSNNEN